MSSIFKFINNYQDCIIASVTAVLGVVQAGVSSWAIHRVVLDEHFLIYIFGHYMHKQTKKIPENISHFSSLKEFLKHDLLDILDVYKIAFSIALISGICQIFFSLLLFFFRAKPFIRQMWLWTSILAFAGLVTGFALLLKNLIQDVLYFQIFLSTTGVNSFVLFHLMASMAVDIFCIRNQKSDDEAEVAEGNSIKTTSTAGSTAVLNIGSSSNASQAQIPESASSLTTQVDNRSRNQSASNSNNIREEVLPLPPPPPVDPIFPISPTQVV